MYDEQVGAGGGKYEQIWAPTSECEQVPAIMSKCRPERVCGSMSRLERRRDCVRKSALLLRNMGMCLAWPARRRRRQAQKHCGHVFIRSFSRGGPGGGTDLLHQKFPLPDPPRRCSGAFVALLLWAPMFTAGRLTAKNWGRTGLPQARPCSPSRGRPCTYLHVQPPPAECLPRLGLAQA